MKSQQTAAMSYVFLSTGSIKNYLRTSTFTVNKNIDKNINKHQSKMHQVLYYCWEIYSSI